VRPKKAAPLISGSSWCFRVALRCQFQHASSGDPGRLRAYFDLLEEVLVDEIMNLSLANAELPSGFTVSKQERKGFVALVHDALLCPFTNKDASRSTVVNDPIVTLRPDF
jgi:hypothetical protein